MSDRSEKVKHDFPIRTEDTLRDVGITDREGKGRASYGTTLGKTTTVGRNTKDSPSVRSDRRHIGCGPSSGMMSVAGITVRTGGEREQHARDGSGVGGMSEGCRN